MVQTQVLSYPSVKTSTSCNTLVKVRLRSVLVNLHGRPSDFVVALPSCKVDLYTHKDCHHGAAKLTLVMSGQMPLRSYLTSLPACANCDVACSKPVKTDAAGHTNLMYRNVSKFQSGNDTFSKLQLQVLYYTYYICRCCARHQNHQSGQHQKTDHGSQYKG